MESGAAGRKPISSPVVRVDAVEKASGAALYLSDLDLGPVLHARMIRTTVSRGEILSVRYPSLPEGFSIVDSRDIPPGGVNGILSLNDDWPVFAHGEVRFLGQTVALAVGPDRGALERIVRETRIEYRTAEPCYTMEDSMAMKGGAILPPSNTFADYTIVKGDPDAAFGRAARIVTEEFRTGFQEHAYLEPQGCVASWEAGKITVRVSCQCPYYVKKAVVHALGCDPKAVRIIQPHTGGGFGGKEHYPDVLATAAAIAAWKLHTTVRIIYDRREDISYTNKRHPSWILFRTALDDAGSVLAMEVDTRLNAGAFQTCSAVVLQRSIFTATGAYAIPHTRVRGRAFASNTVPSDAFRGFGAPQALFAIEMHMDHLARGLGEDPLSFKRRHFLKKGDVTVSRGRIHDEVLLPRMLDRIIQESGYEPGSGRSLGISCFLHGCGFTGSGERDIIKARVILRKSPDGTVRILGSNTDIGQGVLTTFRKVASAVLGIPMDRVIYDRPDTDLVPDSGPTVASRSIMVVGYLIQEAAKKLKACWKDGVEQEAVQDYSHPSHLQWDGNALIGDAYPTYGWGINAVEVALDPATCEVDVKRIWTIYDVGMPIDSLIVEGQAQGGMIQALGYGGLEKMELADGRFRQDSFTDYMIPTSMDFPSVGVELVENPYPFGPFGAKGAGELVFDGGAPAFALAVQDAAGILINEIPVTPERIMELIRARPGHSEPRGAGEGRAS